MSIAKQKCPRMRALETCWSVSVLERVEASAAGLLLEQEEGVFTQSLELLLVQPLLVVPLVRETSRLCGVRVGVVEGGLPPRNGEAPGRIGVDPETVRPEPVPVVLDVFGELFDLLHPAGDAADRGHARNLGSHERRVDLVSLLQRIDLRVRRGTQEGELGCELLAGVVSGFLSIARRHSCLLVNGQNCLFFIISYYYKKSISPKTPEIRLEEKSRQILTFPQKGRKSSYHRSIVQSHLLVRYDAFRSESLQCSSCQYSHHTCLHGE